MSRQTDGAGLVLALESKDAAQLEAARAQLVGSLPKTSILSTEHDASAHSHRRASAADLFALHLDDSNALERSAFIAHTTAAQTRCATACNEVSPDDVDVPD